MRDVNPLAVAFSFIKGPGRDPLGREIISPIEDGADWVQVRDHDGYVSYLPRSHLKENGHPLMASLTYMLSLAYIVPALRFLMT